jgi:hypothetical protein
MRDWQLCYVSGAKYTGGGGAVCVTSGAVCRLVAQFVDWWRSIQDWWCRYARPEDRWRTVGQVAQYAGLMAQYAGLVARSVIVLVCGMALEFITSTPEPWRNYS